MSEWRECWPPNEPPDRIVRGTVRLRLAPGVSSYPIECEDTAKAWTEFMEPQKGLHSYDYFDTDSFPSVPRTTGLPVGGMWLGSGESFDFTV